MKKALKSHKKLGKTKIFTLVLVSVFLVTIIFITLWFRYENAQFDKVFNKVVPSDWKQISSEKYGNRLCADACLGESRTYKASLNKEDAISFFTSRILDSGYKIVERDSHCGDRPRSDYTSSLCYVGGQKGSLYIGMSYNLDNKELPNLDQTNISVSFGHNSHIFGYFKE